MFWLFKAWQVVSDNHKLLQRPLYCHVTWAMYLLWIMTSSWLAYLTYMLHAAFWENACACLTWWIQMTSGSENNELYFTIPGLLISKCLILCSNICRLVFLPELIHFWLFSSQLCFCIFAFILHHHFILRAIKIKWSTWKDNPKLYLYSINNGKLKYGNYFDSLYLHSYL